MAVRRPGRRYAGKLSTRTRGRRKSRLLGAFQLGRLPALGQASGGQVAGTNSVARSGPFDRSIESLAGKSDSRGRASIGPQAAQFYVMFGGADPSPLDVSTPVPRVFAARASGLSDDEVKRELGLAQQTGDTAKNQAI